MRHQPDPHRREMVVMERQDWNRVEACIAHSLVGHRREKTKMVPALEALQQKFAAARKIADAAASFGTDSE